MNERMTERDVLVVWLSDSDPMPRPVKTALMAGCEVHLEPAMCDESLMAGGLCYVIIREKSND